MVEIKCSMPRCNKKMYAKKLCQMHWVRLRQYGDPRYGDTIYSGCRVSTCDGDHHAKGYCMQHYYPMYSYPRRRMKELEDRQTEYPDGFSTVKNLAVMILLRAMFDWQDHGERLITYDDTAQNDDQKRIDELTIYSGTENPRQELLQFYNSDWFTDLATIAEIDPDNMRSILGITSETV